MMVIRTLTCALLAGALLAGCGDQTASSPTAVDSTNAPSDSPSDSPSESPSASPTTGTYPAFAATDYDYTLRLACFCAYVNDPVRVQVRDGKVTSATFIKRGHGHRAGAPAPMNQTTINDIIDEANDTQAAKVDVVWPDGQDYPSSVYVDRDEMTVDEEMGYTIRRVEVLG